jgi:5-methylthioadenosine/S-adenosylhomocysteine deaminase
VEVRGGRILRVGRAQEAQAWRSDGAKPADRIDLGPAAILPGLVNAHSHLELSLLRGFCEELDFFQWIRKLTDAKYQRLDRADFRASARWGALEALRAGITTLGDAADQGDVLDALLESGQRGIVFQEVFGPDPSAAEASEKDLERALDSCQARATPRVRLGISPHAPYTVSPALFRRITALCLKRGLPMAVHAAESRWERSFVEEGKGPFADYLRQRSIPWRAPGLSTIGYLASLGVLEAKPLLIHAIDVSAEDLDNVQRSGAAIAHCPKSNAKLCHGVAPLCEFLAKGIRTGLGTDSVASNNGCDLLEEARCALLFQRARPGAASLPLGLLDARALLRLATLGGAEALGLAAEIGSLEPGKSADLIAVDLSGPHLTPCYEPEAAMVFSATGRDVIWVMVEGKPLYRDGKVATLDEASLREELAVSVSKLRKPSS